MKKQLKLIFYLLIIGVCCPSFMYANQDYEYTLAWTKTHDGGFDDIAGGLAVDNENLLKLIAKVNNLTINR
jgi:hypothetical protein